MLLTSSSASQMESFSTLCKDIDLLRPSKKIHIAPVHTMSWSNRQLACPDCVGRGRSALPSFLITSHDTGRSLTAVDKERVPTISATSHVFSRTGRSLQLLTSSSASATLSVTCHSPIVSQATGSFQKL